MILVCVFVATNMSIGVSLISEKVYAASAQVLLTDQQQESVFDQNGIQRGDPARQVQTQIEVIKSRVIQEEVNKRLGTRADLVANVQVTGIAQTDVIKITAESSLGLVARDAANAYAEVYTEQRRKQSVDALLDIGREVLTRSQDAKKQLDEIDTKIGRLTVPGKPDSASLQNLRTQRESVASQYTLFKEKYDQVQVDAALRRGGAQVVDKAVSAYGPVRPRPLRNGMLGLILGGMLGVGLAFLMEQLDDSIKTSEDIERLIPEVPLLGSIPDMAEWRDREQTKVVTIEDPQSPVSESYRALRTSVQFVALRQPLQTLMITSPMTSEGKSTTLANLAVTLARSGKHVVVVSCDLRRPRIQDFFGGRNAVGFTSVLLGEVPLASAYREIQVSAGGSLRILDTGLLPPNPSELLGTARVAELLANIQATADIVLIDTPPLLPVTDALVLSRRVDGVLLLATAGLTRRKDLAHAAQLLKQAEAPLIGVVFNRAPVEGGRGYGYRYRYTARTPSAAPRTPKTDPTRRDSPPVEATIVETPQA